MISLKLTVIKISFHQKISNFIRFIYTVNMKLFLLHLQQCKLINSDGNKGIESSLKFVHWLY